MKIILSQEGEGTAGQVDQAALLCRILRIRWKIPLWWRHQENHEEDVRGEKDRCLGWEFVWFPHMGMLKKKIERVDEEK